MIVYGTGGIMSPDSKCKPFDARANGYAPFSINYNYKN